MTEQSEGMTGMIPAKENYCKQGIAELHSATLPPLRRWITITHRAVADDRHDRIHTHMRDCGNIRRLHDKNSNHLTLFCAQSYTAVSDRIYRRGL